MKLSQILMGIEDKPSSTGSNSNSMESKPPVDSTKPIKVGAAPQYVPFKASRSNMISNLVINSFFGLGLYWLYKDYQSGKKMPKDSHGTVTIVHDYPNRVFKNKNPNREKNQFSQVFSELTYGDLSFFTIGLGFLMQLANMAHVSFGRKSLLYKSGIFSVLLYPPFTFYMYSLRNKSSASILNN
ncbi:LAFE_0G04720g1_1 [Lachancea fermentati]|uniref:LAFE_0G04720g1_1 n=1 Tax=Lachancea fermentati TaxID=4955 RepID=A0A1G4MH36_LACFM|nr:LAFE_0G04720g1_1 [Lachancea fermentati]